MTDQLLGPCVGCGAMLPVMPGSATHRYMLSSAACWATFNSLQDPDRPLGFAPFNTLTVDAYAAQHPGEASSPQAINSVGIHLLVLHGVLERGFGPNQALWLRQRPNRSGSVAKHDRFHWLTPPSFASCLRVADVVAGATLAERSKLVEAWVKSVWGAWRAVHGDQVTAWFERYVQAERF